eukprot:1892429-Alexandrium_andersonii.AAC.1
MRGLRWGRAGRGRVGLRRVGGRAALRRRPHLHSRLGCALSRRRRPMASGGGAVDWASCALLQLRLARRCV